MVSLFGAQELRVSITTGSLVLRKSYQLDISTYCAYHVLVQPNIRRYYFYFLPDQAQILLDHFNVLDELWCKISFKSDNGYRLFP